MKVPRDPRLDEGIRLFNSGRYFESHEVMEALWMETSGAYRDFYKGLIQIAGCLHLLNRGTYSGARGLSRSARAYLEPFRPETQGLDIQKLLADFESLTAFVLETEPVRPHSEAVKREAIRIRVL